MNKVTGLILASGRGSRMGDIGKPKHLLPLPGGDTIVARLAKQIAPFCSQIICTIREEKFRQDFASAFKDISPNVELLVKKDDYEYSELCQVAELVKCPTTLQTNGDLIFAESEIIQFIEKYKDRNSFVRGREGNPHNKSGLFDVFNSRISLVPSEYLKVFGSNRFNDRMNAYLILLKSLIIGDVARVPTLFNVDDPESYYKACEFLNNSN